MEIIKETTISALTSDSVDVLTREFIERDGQKLQVGNNQRVCYNNIPRDREVIKTALPEAYQRAIFAVWGDMPSRTDPPTEPHTEETAVI